MDWATYWLAILSVLLSVATVGGQLALIVHVLRSTKEPISVLFWILLLIFMPIVGAVAYLLFGMELKKRRLRRRHRGRRVVATPKGIEFDRDAQPVWNLVANLNQLGPWPMTVERFFCDGESLFDDLVESIRAAKQSIWIETYLLRSDALGERVAEALCERARASVDVRILYDAVGSYKTKRRFWRMLRSAGVKVACFSPANPLKGRFQIQYRNHRKITVIDGKLGYVGGFNIGEEYLGAGAPHGVWRDTHLCATGPIVTALAAVFAQDWDFGTGERLPLSCSVDEPHAGGAATAVLASSAEWHIRSIHSILLDRIATARERIDLSTAYFVPDPALRFALCDAARRGVAVRLLVPGYAHKRFVRWASQSFYAELLREGVDIHEFMGGQFHAKVATFDRRWSLVGSANLDARSLRLNDEVALLIDSPAVAQQLAAQFERDLEASVCIEPSGWLHRPRRRAVVERLASLMSPIL